MDDSTDQDAVIAWLSDPATYGGSVPVERIDTHAAILFLTGDKVFKLKRAVDYGYLDFTTLAARKAVCEAELRLNQRTAPDLYMGVMSVNRQADGTLSFGAGEPVDWLVVMHRFAPDALLLDIARRGELTPDMLRDLADGIAAFHAEAEVVPGTDGAARIRRVIEGNRRSFAALEPGALDAAACAALYSRSLAELDGVAALLDRRAAGGHVRRCHGDLHLANICLWKGRPTLFDALEFNDELATTDVLYDLAFLLMDLWERGLRAAASLAFNRYCDMVDESDGLPALPLFLALRAAIRSHVGATAAARQPDAGRRAEKLSEARAYLAAALGFLDRQPPRLVAIGGLSGAGKSTLAGALAPYLGHAPGARWLRTDVLRKRLHGVAPETPLPPEAYTRGKSAEVYARLYAEASAALKGGHAVILDGVFAREGERAQVEQLAREAGVAFTGLWLEAPEDVLLARVSARSGDASDADAPVVRSQLGYAIGDLGAWQRVAAGGSPQDVLAAARLMVSSSPSR